MEIDGFNPRPEGIQFSSKLDGIGIGSSFAEYQDLSRRKGHGIADRSHLGGRPQEGNSGDLQSTDQETLIRAKEIEALETEYARLVNEMMAISADRLDQHADMRTLELLTMNEDPDLFELDDHFRQIELELGIDSTLSIVDKISAIVKIKNQSNGVPHGINAIPQNEGTDTSDKKTDESNVPRASDVSDIDKETESAVLTTGESQIAPEILATSREAAQAFLEKHRDSLDDLTSRCMKYIDSGSFAISGLPYNQENLSPFEIFTPIAIYETIKKIAGEPNKLAEVKQKYVEYEEERNRYPRFSSVCLDEGFYSDALMDFDKMMVGTGKEEARVSYQELAALAVQIFGHIHGDLVKFKEIGAEKFLAAFGVKAIDTAIGDAYNANTMQLEARFPGAKDKVVSVRTRGVTISSPNGTTRVYRWPRVAVGRGEK